MKLATQADVETCLAKWQAVLHLRDWEIEARLVAQETFGDDRCQVADTAVRTNRFGATIRLATYETLDPTESPDMFDMERTLVHELLHCVFQSGQLWADPGKVAKAMNRAYERAIEQTARALVELDRRAA